MSTTTTSSSSIVIYTTFIASTPQHAPDRNAVLPQTAVVSIFFGLEGGQPLGSPMTEVARKMGPNTAGQASRSDVHDYAALVGSLLWVSQGTRPDIAFPVGYLALYMSNPSPAHFLAAQRVLRYLGGTKNAGLCFSSDNQTPIAGWSDSDHATDPTTRHSVAWRSRLQDTVAVSSTEAEYVALSEAAREAKWLRSIMSELGVQLNRASNILTDSKGAEAISRDPADHPKTKHIETHQHLVRQMQERKEVYIGRVHTDSNPADMLTKALGVERLGRHNRTIKLEP